MAAIKFTYSLVKTSENPSVITVISDTYTNATKVVLTQCHQMKNPLESYQLIEAEEAKNADFGKRQSDTFIIDEHATGKKAKSKCGTCVERRDRVKHHSNVSLKG